MNSNEQFQNSEESVDEIEIDMDATSSVDDFIKELEAKEKDLHITSDMTIEIEESEFDTRNVPDLIQKDLAQTAPQPVAPSVRSAASDGLKTRVFELQTEVESL